LRCSSEETLYAWLVGPKEAPEGYLLYSQTTGESGIEVLVRDRVALTQAAHLRIWTLLADLNSVVEKAELRAPANDPGLAMLPEEFATIEHYSRWMLRIVNVVQAFELRGYAADGVLELEVQDEVLPENGGRWRLVVEAGQARMERGGEGTLRATIRGLAPLFTGLFTPYQLCRMGWVEADAASCEVAARLFAGPEPYMADKF
jgi:predicted acetyltransferase